MRIFDWPANLVPTNVDILPPRKTLGLNASISETAQAVPGIRPPFGMTLEFSEIWGAEALAWRALIASLEGRANAVRVPLFDVCHRAGDAAIGAGLVPHSDGTSFSDGALYLTDDLDGVTVTGTQGDRMITADFGGYGRLLEGGLYFGLGDRPYIAQGVWWEGSVATIRCSPTLREDYAAEPLRLKPVMICRQTSDDGGALMLRRARYGTPSIDFVEDFREETP